MKISILSFLYSLNQITNFENETNLVSTVGMKTCRGCHSTGWEIKLNLMHNLVGFTDIGTSMTPETTRKRKGHCCPTFTSDASSFLHCVHKKVHLLRYFFLYFLRSFLSKRSANIHNICDVHLFSSSIFFVCLLFMRYDL